MESELNVSTTERKKIITIAVLFVTSIIIIMFLGVSFSIFSIITNTSFQVLNAPVHGAIFGSLVVYLGIRNFLSVRKLKIEVYKNTSQFSWSNFKKEKKSKVVKNRK